MTRTTMRLIGAAAVAVVAACGGAMPPLQAAKVGEAAPAFTAVDSNGRQHSLADFKGRWVVLEWHNQGCPYVRKHYSSGNMQKLQREWTGKGVVWLTVISSAPGQQGHATGEQANAYVKAQNAAPTAVLLDPQGTMGMAYGARTTPHMYVISPEARLIYNGAIDDKPTTDVGDVPGATNYLSAALTQAMAGQPVTTATTKPYGCSVKYASPSSP